MVDLGDASEKLMGMDDATWRRHANPWSGWSRVATLPALALAIWSRVWIGWWALALVAAVLLWTWLNPRLFPEPRSLDNWMSRGVMGERIWLARKREPIPAHHARMANLLNALSALAMVPFAWGLWQLEIWPTVFGMAVSMLAKLWFVDRMVTLRRIAEGQEGG
tara:strand:- start:126 stop:617 length:492 start_codon:yes stop_codon:yes gene_type:complete